MSSRSKKSLVWDYFKVSPIDENKAICDTCSEVISRRGTQAKAHTTSNLRSHLSTHYKEKYQELDTLYNCYRLFYRVGYQHQLYR